MSELKVARGVIGITSFRNKLVLSTLQPEDAGKSERPVEDQHGQPLHEEWTALTAAMLGLWSGKIEKEDGGDIQVAVPTAFRREFAEETQVHGLPGIVLEADQLRGRPLYAGKIEQIRPPVGKVLFWGYALPAIEFTWEQMNELSKRQKPGQDLWELAIEQAAEQLRTNSQFVRPATRLAIQALLAQPEMRPAVWQVPLSVRPSQSADFNQAWCILYTSFLWRISTNRAKYE